MNSENFNGTIKNDHPQKLKSAEYTELYVTRNALHNPNSVTANTLIYQISFFA
jgi:hypothetical protein